MLHTITEQTLVPDDETFSNDSVETIPLVQCNPIQDLNVDLTGSVVMDDLQL